MGCISSSPKSKSGGAIAIPAESSVHDYRVINLDSTGARVCEGNMTVSRVELKLICENRNPMTWPLNGLRRYGHDQNVFSIEAGRHCQSPEGIYQFYCERADELFLTMQMYIQNQPPVHGFGDQQQQQQQLATEGGGGDGDGELDPASASALANGGGASGGAAASGGSAGDVWSRIADGGHYTEQAPQRAALLANRSAATSRNLRLGAIGSAASATPGGPLSPDARGVQTTIAANGGVGNVYQDCTTNGGARTVLSTVSEQNESNNNVFPKRLSLDIPPAEPAPSPSGQPLPLMANGRVVTIVTPTNACTSPRGSLSPSAATSPHMAYYCNTDFPPLSASYANAAAITSSAAAAAAAASADYAPERAYMNVQLGAADQPKSPLAHCASPQPSHSSHSIASSCGQQLQPSADEVRLYQNLDLPVGRRSSTSTSSPITASTASTAKSCSSGAIANALSNGAVSHLRRSTVACASSSAASSTSAVATTPTTPLFAMTTEQLLSEPSSPSMLYITLDLDHTASMIGSASAEQSQPLLSGSVSGGFKTTTSTSIGTAKQQQQQHRHEERVVPRTPSVHSNLLIGAGGSNATLPPDSPKYNSGAIGQAAAIGSNGTPVQPMDYAKIDFNKTLALSHSTTPSTALDSEESRRTRHSSTAKAPGDL